MGDVGGWVRGTHTIYIKQVVPEARASNKPLDATEVQQKRKEILETHGNLLKRAGAESDSFRPRKKTELQWKRCSTCGIIKSV